jgi:hypothetical protein
MITDNKESASVALAPSASGRGSLAIDSKGMAILSGTSKKVYSFIADFG